MDFIDFYNQRNEKLVGILEPTESLENLVLLLHPFESGKNDKRLLQIAQYFLHSLIPSFRFDFAGSCASEGDKKKQTITSCTEDTVAAYATVKKLGYKKIHLYGISMGAMVAEVAAGKNTYQSLTLESMIIYPASTMDAIAIEGRVRTDKENSTFICRDKNEFRISKLYLEDYSRYDMVSLAKEVMIPTLILWGEGVQK